jgi:hypothetical protein
MVRILGSTGTSTSIGPRGSRRQWHFRARGSLADLRTINRLVVGECHPGGDDILRVTVGNEDRHAKRCGEKALPLGLGLCTGAGLLIVVTFAKLALLDLNLGFAPLLWREEAA